jgi:hypothetical protein
MAFPTTPLIDNFARANENPLASPWAVAAYWWASPLVLLSNHVANGNVTGPTSFASGSFFVGGQFGPDFEVYFTVDTLPALANEGFGLDLFLDDPADPVGPQSTFDVNFYREGGGTYHCTLSYWLDDIFQGDLYNLTGVTLTAGDQLGVRRIGAQWTLYRNGVPLANGSTRGSYLSTILAGLYIDEDTANQVTRLRGFGGGTIPRTTITPSVVGSVSSGRATGTSLLIFSHTVAPGTDALLIYCPWDSFTGYTPTVDCSGVAVPLLNFHSPLRILPATFLLRNPPSGGVTITITPNPTQVLPVSMAAAAVNITNFGGIRYGDWAGSFVAPTDPPTYTPSTVIYTEPTDLLLSCIVQVLASATFTPVGMSLLHAQNGLADTNTKLALAQTNPTGLRTTIDWTLLDDRVFQVHVEAIKGIAAPPFDAPESLGSVSNTYTTENQPANSNPPDLTVPLILPPGEYWKFWHRVPFGYTTQMVMVAWSDQTTPVTAVLIGGVAATRIAHERFASWWVLEGVAAGTYEVEIRQAGRRTFTAGVYSLSTSGIIATSYNEGFFPALAVDSQPDAIAIALVNYPRIQEMVITPDAGNTMLFEQPLFYNSQPSLGNRPLINESIDAGFSFYRIADDASTFLGWTPSPSGWDNVRMAFSYIPAPLPPPPPPVLEGCPNTLIVLPVSGTGCRNTLPLG